jgi:hypothetical protein
MKYVYFIAYRTAYSGGSLEYITDKKIEDYDQINEVEDYIRKNLENCRYDIVITNFILLRKEKEEKPIMQEHCEWCSGELKGNYLDNECVKCGRSTDFK